MKKLFACLLLLSCWPDPTQKMTDMISDRFEVHLVGTFHDGLAYDNRRGIYLILDHATGKEFLGLSGIGISEVSARQDTHVIVQQDGSTITTTSTVEEER